jgi:predicted metal-dependent HD superfamily phosphohydrolase
MKQRWASLAGRVGQHAGAAEVDLTFALIEAAYAHPRRPYHTLEHVAACLEMLDGVASMATSPDAIEFALWLHDAVYVAPRSDNEARSGDAAALIGAILGCDPEFIATVRMLIDATTHRTVPAPGDASLICDIDMAILGSAPDVYDHYARAIREEYSFATDAQYRAGRAAFLERTLRAAPIFVTDHFRSVHEGSAIANLRRELAMLVAGA